MQTWSSHPRPSTRHPVLGLIAAGSKGPTLDQLLTFLKSKTTEEINFLSSQLVTIVLADGGPLGGPRLSFVSSVWVDQSLTLKPTFKEIVDTVYKAAVSNVNFRTKAVEVTKEVNHWAEKETSGLIKEILPSGSVDFSTRLIFANAVHFKGTWLQKFDASNTKDDKFFLLDGSSVQVPFMTSKEMQYIRRHTSSGFKVLKLPNEQGHEEKRKFSMYIFLPDAKDGLPALVEKMGSESGFIEKHLRHRSVEVIEFRIPKFKISFGFEASKVLEELGLVLPFSGDGLTEMVDQKLNVSSIYHKSFIEVNEEGTTDAAITEAHKTKDLRRDIFVANHPFLFVVREDTNGVLLFIGQIHNPHSG